MSQTTALDVTIQTQIMDLMRQMNKKTNTAILLISHDLGVVSRLCSRVYIMYAGRIVESGPVDEILTNPLHPYTKGLVEAIPDITKRGKPLKGYTGAVCLDYMQEIIQVAALQKDASTVQISAKKKCHR